MSHQDVSQFERSVLMEWHEEGYSGVCGKMFKSLASQDWAPKTRWVDPRHWNTYLEVGRVKYGLHYRFASHSPPTWFYLGDHGSNDQSGGFSSDKDFLFNRGLCQTLLSRDG